MHGCPCGYLGDKKRECSCKQFEIERYHRKLSGPLLDRIDLQVYVPRLEYADLQSREAGESSAVIRERVIKARQLQLLRLQGTNLYCNAQMGRRELNKHCQMEAAAEAVDRAGSIVEESRKLTERNLEILATVRTRGPAGSRTKN